MDGAPFEKKLISDTPEGIKLQPIYSATDLNCLTHLGSMPGSVPFVRGSRATGYLREPWRIAQECAALTPHEAGTLIAQALTRGQNAITLQLDRATREGMDPDISAPLAVCAGGTSLASVDDVMALFKAVPLAETPIYIKARAGSVSLAALIFAAAEL